MVAGSLYKAVDKDFDGNPLKYKTGPKAGQERVEYYFAVAIPKTKSNWWEEPWGATILQVGAQSFPQGYQRKDFAWKITDGDSTELNKRNKRPCDNEGYKGHWVLNLRGGHAPKTYRMVNNEPIPMAEGDQIKPGYYVQVAFNVEGNGNQNNPGVYLNHSMVCLRGYGPEILAGPDVKDAGFGGGALPAGASDAPLAVSSPFPPAASSATNLPAAPIPAPSVAVVPNPGFLQVPPPSTPLSGVSMSAGGVIPPASAPASPSNLPSPPAPPAPSGPIYLMTAQAGNYTREQYNAQGWSDAQLIQAGYMTQQ